MNRIGTRTGSLIALTVVAAGLLAGCSSTSDDATSVSAPKAKPENNACAEAKANLVAGAGASASSSDAAHKALARAAQSPDYFPQAATALSEASNDSRTVAGNYTALASLTKPDYAAAATTAAAKLTAMANANDDLETAMDNYQSTYDLQAVTDAADAAQQVPLDAASAVSAATDINDSENICQ
ncbi:hypothetical protein AX769_13905 [Frondihabitans sp. PAMC 28766]|uniref:hypothetical protein n=1 Tax=Frondihabitans sp. PAMC 28766 TaxID=1795630 RepID=UPI00078EAC40|nr:hypothetical protein [Frondihabitans sp. PAMC 28766]AMM21027.1 hypothetical protein AX769_13905 [Frondihabitans sp. PAMC 28766]